MKKNSDSRRTIFWMGNTEAIIRGDTYHNTPNKLLRDMQTFFIVLRCTYRVVLLLLLLCICFIVRRQRAHSPCCAHLLVTMPPISRPRIRTVSFTHFEGAPLSFAIISYISGEAHLHRDETKECKTLIPDWMMIVAKTIKNLFLLKINL